MIEVNLVLVGLLGAGLLAGSLLIGLALGRARAGAARRKVLELEMELKHAREASAAYQDRVADHFERTSDLIHALTYQFRDVYEHLSDGARELCPDRLPPLGRGSMEDVLLADLASESQDEDDDLALPPSGLDLEDEPEDEPEAPWEPAADAAGAGAPAADAEPEAEDGVPDEEPEAPERH